MNVKDKLSSDWPDPDEKTEAATVPPIDLGAELRKIRAELVDLMKCPCKLCGDCIHVICEEMIPRLAELANRADNEKKGRA